MPESARALQGRRCAQVWTPPSRTLLFRGQTSFLAKDQCDQHAGGLEPQGACDDPCNQLGFKFSLLSGGFLRGSPLSFLILQAAWEDGIGPLAGSRATPRLPLASADGLPRPSGRRPSGCSICSVPR